MAQTAEQRVASIIGDFSIEEVVSAIAGAEGGKEALVKKVQEEGYNVRAGAASKDRVSVKIKSDEMGYFIELSQNLGLKHAETARVALGVKDAPESPEPREPSEEDNKHKGSDRMVHLMLDPAERERLDASIAKLPPFMQPKSPNTLLRYNLYAMDLSTGIIGE